MFIAFEGIDGCGKKTQLRLIQSWIERNGYTVASSSEPNDDQETGTPTGKLIRAMLNGSVERPKDALEFQSLYVHDRAHDVSVLIAPVLAKDDIYLIERFELSTYCYGIASGLTKEQIKKLHDDIIGPEFLRPDLTIFLDIDVDVALERLRIAGRGDIFEKKDFLLRVRAQYHALTLPQRFSGEILQVDANQHHQDVFKDIRAIVRERAERYLLQFA